MIIYFDFYYYSREEHRTLEISNRDSKKKYTYFYILNLWRTRYKLLMLFNENKGVLVTIK